MSSDEKPPAAKARHAGTPGLLLGLGAALLVFRAAAAVAFPLIDPTNEDQVPTGTELATPDAQDLQHQLQIVNGLAAPPDGGWTFVPRLDVQELLTDNVFQQHAPRRWDMVTYVAPGFSVAADTPRLQLSFSYAPTLALYARTGSLNALTQQFTGTGLVTVIPELAYVDVRAVSGVQSLYGGLGGLGTIGASPAAVDATAATIPSLAGNGLGLNKGNEVQTSSFGVSPYLLRRFGDWGTGKIGYSVNVTESDLVTGFAPPPFPTGGTNGQSLISNEEIAHFATGEFLGPLQDSIDADLTQSSYNTGTNYATNTTGPLGANNNNVTSTRAIFSDQVSYVLNRGITVFASGGHEDISYTNSAYPHINDLIWSFGTTLTPNAESLLTVSYGHLNGFNSFTASGHYAVTARTVLTVSYGSTLGTQLENVQNQLNLATTGSGGSLVNARTGSPLFGNINALGVHTGVFRTDTFTLGAQTSLERDILSANLLLTKQSQQNGRTAPPTTADTISLQWLHQIHPDLTLSSAVAYSLQQQATGELNPGNSKSVAASVALQYQISDTLSTSLRYSFFDRQSAITAYQVYQNLLILGISKTF